ncbi:MAG: Holliday junction resolvase RuvX [Ignavibacteriales bacterium]|nr:Holliday junction resolvase RuvX [Ignavibacteriales bacterium]
MAEERASVGRLMGVDYGSQRIGLALSDPLGIIAQPLETIPNDPNTVSAIVKLSSQQGVVGVVVGMPLNLKGEIGAKAKEVEAFIQTLKENLDIDVVCWDERFTSTIAQHTLRSMGTTKRQRREDKGRIDAMAAALILQSFLDRTKHSRTC